MRNTTGKRGTRLLATHASPYVPTLDVHVEQAMVPRDFDGGAETELNGERSISSLSPAVQVSPAILSLLSGGTGAISASPLVRVVHVSAYAPTVDVAFWDGATGKPVSDDSDQSFGDASKPS